MSIINIERCSSQTEVALFNFLDSTLFKSCNPGKEKGTRLNSTEISSVSRGEEQRRVCRGGTAESYEQYEHS